MSGPEVHQLLLLEMQFASHCINKGESSTVRGSKGSFHWCLLLLGTYITFLQAGDGCNKANLNNMERDPSREKTQWLTPLSNLFLTYKFQKTKFCLLDVFLLFLPCLEGTWGQTQTALLISEKEDCDNCDNWFNMQQKGWVWPVLPEHRQSHRWG